MPQRFDRRGWFAGHAGNECCRTGGAEPHDPGQDARVVIGGGFGGAICSGYQRRFSPDLEVTLVERGSRFVTGTFSNIVPGGMNDIDIITHGYARL